MRAVRVRSYAYNKRPRGQIGHPCSQEGAIDCQGGDKL